MTILEPVDLDVALPEVPKEPSPMGEPIGRSVASTLSSPTGRVIVIILVFLWTIPTFGVLASSFRSEIDVKTTGWWQIFWKGNLTLSNYTQVLGSKNGGDNLGHFFINSLRITIPAVILSVGVAALAAYAFSWMEFKGRDWLFVIVVALLVVPLQMALIPLGQLFTGGAHRLVHDLPQPQPAELGPLHLDRPRVFRDALLHLPVEELHVVVAEGTH